MSTTKKEVTTSSVNLRMKGKTGRDPRAGCFECYRRTWDFHVLRAQHSIRAPRKTKFLSPSAVKKRIRREFSFNINALEKFLDDKYGRPIVQEPEESGSHSFRTSVWDLARLLSYRSVGGSQSGTLDLFQKVPIIEEPPQEIKDFPLTQESVKKHIVKATAVKKEEKVVTVRMVKKKQEELKRLKGELETIKKKQFCHHGDKEALVQTRKMNYLKKLADENNLNLEVLIRNGDIIYNNHRLEMKRLHEEKVKRMEERISLIAEHLKIDNVNEDDLKRKKPTEKESKRRSAALKTEETELSNRSEDMKSVPLTAQSKEVYLAERDDELEIESVTSSTITERSNFRSSSSNLYDDVLLHKIKETWCPGTEDPGLPQDTTLILTPNVVLFHGFCPSKLYQNQFHLYNPKRAVVDCCFIKVITKSCIKPGSKLDVKFQDEEMFKVCPDSVVRLKPGEGANFSVDFGTDLWYELEDEIKAVVWLWSRIAKTRQLCRVSVNILCTKHEGCIQVENPKIQFGRIAWWKNEQHKEELVITNYSPLDFIVYLNREKSSGEEEACALSEKWVTLLNKIKTGRQTLISSHLSVKSHSTDEMKYLSDGCLETVNGILLTLLDEVYEPFRVHLTRGVLLGPESSVRIPIRFVPNLVRNVDIVEEKFTVTYVGDLHPLRKETVTLRATMIQTPLKVSPEVIDMQVTMIEVGIWQKQFQVLNTADKFCNVRVKLPNCLRKHFRVLPGSFILRPFMKEELLLRAKVGWGIYQDAVDLLEKNLNLLEFAVSLQLDGFPELPIDVLAVVSHPLALSLEPTSINFGFVNTSETAVQEFWLKNHTVVPLHFAFLNVPKWGMIMPNYGISTIRPAQRIKFQFLYSPTAREAGKIGGQAVHIFSVSCTTLERLAAAPTAQIPTLQEKVFESSKRVLDINEDSKVSTLKQFVEIPIDEYMSEMSDTSKSDVDFESLSFLKENLTAIHFEEKKETISDLKSKKSKLKLDISSSKMSTVSAMDESDEFGESETETELSPEHNMKPFITLKCRAIVIDPLCEFTAQKIILPDTPYESFSINSIYLRCPNETSGPSCFCGRLDGLCNETKSDLKARFELFSTKNVLDVQPVSGEISYGQKVKIYFILKPIIREEEISDYIAKQIKSPKKIQSRQKNPSPASKSQTPRSAPLNPNQLKDNPKDYGKVKLRLLRNKKDTPFHTRVKCLVERNMESESCYEVLHCDVFSRFTRPDIAVVTRHKNSEIVFPKTAIGTKRWDILEVHNTSVETVYVTRSFLGHRNRFSCSLLPPSSSGNFKYEGIPLEPEQLLKLKVTFRPDNEDLVEEYFELRANSTVIRMKLSGVSTVGFKFMTIESSNRQRLVSCSTHNVIGLIKYPGQGVPIQYALSSYFSFYKMETTPGSKVEEVVSVFNKSEVELKLEVMTCFNKETYSQEVFNKGNNTDHLVKSNQRLSKRMVMRELKVNPDVTKDLNDYFEESIRPSPIKVEPSSHVIPPNKKGRLRISFYPRLPKAPGIVYSVVQGNKSAENEDTAEMKIPTGYAMKVQVVLGQLLTIADWLIIGKNID